MIFSKTQLPGVFLIDIEPAGDSRGFFARSWCHKEFADAGLSTAIKQINIANSKQAGTLRGMHYQVSPYGEDKVIRCVRGAAFDVAVDVRPESETYLQWIGVELTADNRKALYIPKGFAHGYQTLEGDTELHYLVSEFYTPDAESGLRYDDPAIGIEWPVPVQVISDKDSQWPLMDSI